MTHRIKLFDTLAKSGIDPLRNRFEVGGTVTNPHAIIVRSTKIETTLFPSLLAVARAGAGTNTITVSEATKDGVCVMNTPGANANAVAELVLSTLGCFARNVHKAWDFIRALGPSGGDLEKQIESGKKRFVGFELNGKTFGVIGLGQIGVKVANLGLRYGMKVVGFDPDPQAANMHQLHSSISVTRNLNELLASAHIITVHVPLIPGETAGLINTATIQRMCRGTIIMNFARGEICNTNAITDALVEGHLGGYITDFPDEELLSHDHVFMTPHLGASTGESEENCATMAAEQIADFLLTGSVRNSVNFPTLVMPLQGKPRVAIVNSNTKGMIQAVTGYLAEDGINIASMQNASKGPIGYTLIDTDSNVPLSVIEDIRKLSGVLKVRMISPV
ncbi:hypothetical protein EBR66_04495 [bacterium]|nr:hypothetical protein [bacterium]